MTTLWSKTLQFIGLNASMIVDIYSSSLHVWFSDSLSIPKKSASDSEWSGLRRGTDLVLKFWGLKCACLARPTSWYSVNTWQSQNTLQHLAIHLHVTFPFCNHFFILTNLLDHRQMAIPLSVFNSHSFGGGRGEFLGETLTSFFFGFICCRICLMSKSHLIKIPGVSEKVSFWRGSPF